MRAVQNKVAKVVIEGLLVKPDNIHVPAFMICMAMLAACGRYILALAMKTALLLKILRHLFVAGKAQGGLRGFVKIPVTFLALFLKFGMSLDQGPRHHHTFENTLRTRRCRDQQNGPERQQGQKYMQQNRFDVFHTSTNEPQ